MTEMAAAFLEEICIPEIAERSVPGRNNRQTISDQLAILQDRTLKTAMFRSRTCTVSSLSLVSPPFGDIP